MFNEDQVMSLVRSLVAIGSGWLVGHGYQTESDAALYGGVVMSFAPIVWGMYAKRDAGLIASAASVPDVEQIVTTQKKADASPSDKVVGPNG